MTFRSVSRVNLSGPFSDESLLGLQDAKREQLGSLYVPRAQVVLTSRTQSIQVSSNEHLQLILTSDNHDWNVYYALVSCQAHAVLTKFTCSGRICFLSMRISRLLSFLEQALTLDFGFMSYSHIQYSGASNGEGGNVVYR